MMLIYRKLKTFFNNPKTIIEKVLFLTARMWPDELYLRMLFLYHYGSKLNLKAPKSFSEKIQWLKLYDRNPKYSVLVDKSTVKDYVSQIIGEKYIIPTLQIFDTIEDLNIEKLPSQFVLKTTHGGGSCGVIICKDKSNIEIDNIKQKIKIALKQDNYLTHREWPYKNASKRIIVEQYMQDGDSEELRDYKFYCFNGQPLYCQVITNRSTDETIDFYDEQWNYQPFTGFSLNAIRSDKLKEKPLCYEEMLEISKKLSKDIPFVRVDLYLINNRVYFGELTFFPNAGFGSFVPTEWNLKMGSLLSLAGLPCIASDSNDLFRS